MLLLPWPPRVQCSGGWNNVKENRASFPGAGGTANGCARAKGQRRGAIRCGGRRTSLRVSGVSWPVRISVLQSLYNPYPSYVAPAPGYVYGNGGWRGHEWREHREHEWREHERREHEFRGRGEHEGWGRGDRR